MNPLYKINMTVCPFCGSITRERENVSSLNLVHSLLRPYLRLISKLKNFIGGALVSLSEFFYFDRKFSFFMYPLRPSVCPSVCPPNSSNSTRNTDSEFLSRVKHTILRVKFEEGQYRLEYKNFSGGIFSSKIERERGR